MCIYVRTAGSANGLSVTKQHNARGHHLVHPLWLQFFSPVCMHDCLTVNDVNPAFSCALMSCSGGAFSAKQPHLSAGALSSHSAPPHAQWEGRGSRGQGSQGHRAHCRERSTVCCNHTGGVPTPTHTHIVPCTNMLVCMYLCALLVPVPSLLSPLGVCVCVCVCVRACVCMYMHICVCFSSCPLYCSMLGLMNCLLTRSVSA